MQEIIDSFGKIVIDLVKVGIGVAILVFLWGVALFVFKSSDQKTHEEGRNRMLWGIIALFVMMSVWGLVQFLQVTFGLDFYAPPDPGVKGPIPHQVCSYDATLKRDICFLVQ